MTRINLGTDSSGRPLIVDDRTLAKLHLAEQRLGFKFTIVQGSWRGDDGAAASAGTHDRGGVIDLRTWNLPPDISPSEAVRELRRAGLIAWYRDQIQGFDPHIHAIDYGNPDLSTDAAWQVTEWKAGRNGLASRGPDDGADVPIPMNPPEDDMPYTDWPKKDRDALVADVAAAVLDSKILNKNAAGELQGEITVRAMLTNVESSVDQARKAVLEEIRNLTLTSQADAPKSVERSTLSVVTANLWRENPRIDATLKTLFGSGATIIGMNEAAPWTDQIRLAAATSGYQAFGIRGGRRALHQNPIALHDDITVHEVEHRRLSAAVGPSPERVGTCVRFDLNGQPVAAVNVHGNSHVQAGPTTARELPRVREYVDGMQILTGWVKELRSQHHRPIVTGDLNWAWTGRDRQWKWSPEAVFGRLGMVCQYDYGVLPRPKGDDRPIEYVAWHPLDFTHVSQRFLSPEWSDHPFHEVILKETP